MLESGLAECQERNIRLVGFASSSVKEMIGLLYTGRLSGWSKYLDMDLMLDLLLLGDMYGLAVLKAQATAGYLSQPLCKKGSGYRYKMDLGLLIRWFQTVFLQGDQELIQKSAQFIVV